MNLDECAYDSPIELYCRDVAHAFQIKVEGKIFNTVCDMGIKIEKDKLIQCLQQDKQRYTEAYHRGYAARENDIVRCKNCKHFAIKDYWVDAPLPVLVADKVPTCTKWGRGCKTEPDGYCFMAERKDNEDG